MPDALAHGLKQLIGLLHRENKGDKIAIVGQSYNEKSSENSSQADLFSLNNRAINSHEQQQQVTQ